MSLLSSIFKRGPTEERFKELVEGSLRAVGDERVVTWTGGLGIVLLNRYPAVTEGFNLRKAYDVWKDRGAKEAVVPVFVEAFAKAGARTLPGVLLELDENVGPAARRVVDGLYVVPSLISSLEQRELVTPAVLSRLGRSEAEMWEEALSALPAPRFTELAPQLYRVDAMRAIAAWGRFPAPATRGEPLLVHLHWSLPALYTGTQESGAIEALTVSVREIEAAQGDLNGHALVWREGRWEQWSAVQEIFDVSREDR